MKKFILAIPVGLLSLLATAFVAYLSLASDPLEVSQIHLFPGADKLAHIILYLCLTAVYLADYAKYKLPHHTSTNMECFLTTIAIVVGMGLEVAQLLLPEQMRSFEILDWVADIVGAVLGFLLMKLKLLHYERKWLYGTSVRRSHHKRHRHYHETDSDM